MSDKNKYLYGLIMETSFTKKIIDHITLSLPQYVETELNKKVKINLLINHVNTFYENIC